MTRYSWYLAILVGASLVALNVLASRIDLARSDARASVAHVRQLSERLVSLEQHANVVTLHVQGVNGELAVCRRRTEHLRGTLEVLILSNAHWPERVELPRLEGWPAWPSPRGKGERDAR